MASDGAVRNGEVHMANRVYGHYENDISIVLEQSKYCQLSRGTGHNSLRRNGIPEPTIGNDRKTDRVVGPQLAPGPNVRSPSETFYTPKKVTIARVEIGLVSPHLGATNPARTGLFPPRCHRTRGP
jgi:hypothetical protein